MNLAIELNKLEDIEVDIFHPVFVGDVGPLYKVSKSEYNTLNVYKLTKEKSSETHKIYNKKVYTAFENFLNTNHYDLIHFHGFGQLSLSPVSVCYNLNIPMTLTLHDHWLLCDRWHLVRKNLSTCSGPDSIAKCTECYMFDNKTNPQLEPFIKEYKEKRKHAVDTFFNNMGKVKTSSSLFGKGGAREGLMYEIIRT